MQPNEPDRNQLNEPQAEYGKKRITVFNAFQAMEADRITVLASLSYEQRLAVLSRNRKSIFKSILLPGEIFPPFKKIIQVSKLTYEF